MEANLTHRTPSLAHVSLQLSGPGYDGWPVVQRMPDRVADGTVLIATLEDRPPWPHSLQSTVGLVREFRRAFPALVIGAKVNFDGNEEALEAFRVLQASGVRLMVPGQVSEASVRGANAQAGLSVFDLETWLMSTLSPHGIRETGLVKLLAQLTAGHNIRGGTVDRCRRWTRKLGLPPWGAWRTVGRLVRAVVRLQVGPGPLAYEVGQDEGFADGPTFSRACSRVFGEPPTQLRTMIGWEWLLHRFLTRHMK